MMRLKTFVRLSLCGLVAVAAGVPAMAQQATPAAAAPTATAPAPQATTAPAKGNLNVELNALTPSAKGCMMTFVAENDMATPITKISFELAFFNEKNAVDKVTVLDFRDLPVSKKRVRQFDMPNVKCEAVTRVIINDTPVCDGPSLGECKAALTTKSDISVPFEG